VPISEVNGITMHYLDEGQGEVLLFVHGLGEDCTSWSDQVKCLSPDYRVICPDLRGHGRSGYNNQEITIKLLAEDLVVLLDQLNIDQVHFCGLSLGGLIAFEFYRLYPERVASMILANTFATIPEPYRSQNLKQGLEMLEELPMDEYGRIFALNCLSKQSSPQLFLRVASMFGSNRLEPYRQALTAVYTADYTDFLSEISLPTLILTGEYDRNAPLSFAQKLAEGIPNSRLTVIKNVGHLSNLESPEEFNREVKTFLEGLK
jgi:3-oxoadipate enol-lactonase